jgi:hypothetical protein
VCGVRREWGAIAAGMALVAVAAALVLLSLPDPLPSCRSVTGNIDGTGGTPCGHGLDWDSQNVVGTVVASVLALAGAIGVGLGLRQHRGRRSGAVHAARPGAHRVRR